MAGRPKAFSRDEVLTKAMDLFWSQGYTATGLRDLLDHLGIGRQSLYDTFGSKHALFVEALRLYDQQVTQQTEQMLEAPGSPLQNLRATVRAWSTNATAPPCRGCLINNSITELSLHDPAVADVVRGHLRRLEAVLQRTLERAVAAGELPPDTDVRMLARFFTNTCQGMIVMGKAGMGRAALEDVAGVALSVLG